MKVKNENRLNMYLVLIEYINTLPAAIIALMPGFSEFYTAFTTNVNAIRAKNEVQSSSRTGFRIKKVAGKLDTVTYAIFMADCITAYALSINDTVLVQQMKFSKTALLKKRDTAMADDAQFILSKAVELLAGLESFGIKQQQIDEFTAKIKNFNDNIPLPRININKRKLLTKEIEDLFKATEVILARMDKLIDILILLDQVVYTSYYFSRKVVNNSGRKLALRGIVSDKIGNPITAVVVAITAINRETKTTDKGYYEFKNLPAGFHELTFTRVDYEKTSAKAGTISGQRVQLDVTMEASNPLKKAA
jgi:hypothetical protein